MSDKVVNVMISEDEQWPFYDIESLEDQSRLTLRGVPEETHKRWVDVMAKFWRVQNEIRDYVMRWEEDNDE